MANAISWINLVQTATADGTNPDKYEIRLTPRGDTQGTFNLKLHIVSVDYTQNTSDIPFTVVLNGECAVTTLKIPSSAPNTVTSLTYVIEATATAQTISLFSHDQAPCMFTETAIINPAASTLTWLT